MKPSDRKDFALLIAGIFAYHRAPCSDALIAMYWTGCQRWDLEQVQKAINELTADPDLGRFPPKIADMTRVLEGTKTDLALLAWGKVLDGMQRVGAYETVCFDEGLIHAVIEDMGGWVKLCRSELSELPHVQRRFTETYRAYTARGGVQFPPVLPGAHDAGNALRGYSTARPVLIGDPHRAGEVLRLGVAAPKTQITGAASALVLPRVLQTTESA